MSVNCFYKAVYLIIIFKSHLNMKNKLGVDPQKNSFNNIAYPQDKSCNFGYLSYLSNFRVACPKIIFKMTRFFNSCLPTCNLQ